MDHQQMAVNLGEPAGVNRTPEQKHFVAWSGSRRLDWEHRRFLEGRLISRKKKKYVWTTQSRAKHLHNLVTWLWTRKSLWSLCLPTNILSSLQRHVAMLQDNSTDLSVDTRYFKLNVVSRTAALSTIGPPGRHRIWITVNTSNDSVVVHLVKIRDL